MTANETDGVGDRFRGEDDLKTIPGQNFGGDLREAVGEKPAVKTDDNFGCEPVNFGLGICDFGLPIIRRGLGDARHVGKVEILCNDRAPAIRAEFDLCHKRRLNLQIRQRGIVGVDDLAHFFYGGAHVVPVKQGRAGNKRVGAGAGAFGGGLVIDAAVHLDAIRQFSFAPPSLGLLDFRQAFVDEFLSAEAGIDGHHQQQVNLFEIAAGRR